MTVSPYIRRALERMALRQAATTDAATDKQMRQGAAIHGIYVPPQEPWTGHNEDVLFTASRSEAWWEPHAPPAWRRLVPTLVLLAAGLLALVVAGWFAP